jgi:regulatory protein
MDEAFQSYLTKAMYFLKFRPRSEKEVRDNLHKKALKGKTPLTPETEEQVISWLKTQKYINDVEFARWWIEQRNSFKPTGQRLIVMELRQKGVTQEIIEDVYKSQESGIKNQGELIKQLVEKKMSKYQGLPRQEIYQKLGAYLGRRGFDWETIKRSIDEIFSNGV